MTKKELAYILSEKYDVPKGISVKVVQGVFDMIVDVLVKDGRLELRNFGVFEVKARKARIGRNPKTLKEVPIPARKVVKFKAGKILKSKMGEVPPIIQQ